jgi:hypothetical protein
MATTPSTAPAYAVYAGRVRLGSILTRGEAFQAYTVDELDLGLFQTCALAANAIADAAADAVEIGLE